VAAGAGELLLAAELELLELNPVVVYEEGAVVIDALARESFRRRHEHVAGSLSARHA